MCELECEKYWGSHSIIKWIKWIMRVYTYRWMAEGLTDLLISWRWDWYIKAWHRTHVTGATSLLGRVSEMKTVSMHSCTRLACVYTQKCTYVCIDIWICMHVCMYICMYMCVNVYICAYMHACVGTYVWANEYMWEYVHTHIYIYTYVYLCLYVCIYIHAI